MNPINSIWTEKYRPKKVSELVGDFKHKIMKYLENPQAIPHFLFHSKTPGTGKCLTGDEMFFTKNGLISFEDYCKKNNIKEEYTDKKEELFDIENNFVNSEYFYKSESNIISITTKRGFSLRGTPNHKIKIFDKSEGIIWKKLSDIIHSDIIPIFYNTKIFGNNNTFDYSFLNKKNKRDFSSINIKKPIEINNDIGYLLGVFTANGLFDKNTVNISTTKNYVYEKIKNILKDEFGLITGSLYKESAVFRCGGVRLKRFLVDVCGCCEETARNKNVPKKILESSESVQMNFINGLFEDSWMSNEGYIDYSTASKQLSKEVQLILLNLGFFTTHKEKYLEEYNHIYHTLTIPVEHSKKFIEYFDYIYKNKKRTFKLNMNTNILSYRNIMKEFVINKRKEKNISRYIVFSNQLEKIKRLKPSIKLFKEIIMNFIEKESYLEPLKIFYEQNIFLDGVSEIRKEDKKYVYDFHIPNTHSFLASGIINHNTTLAKAIINELGCDSLILNSSDDRKIDVVREKVKQFSVTQSSKEGLKRCVFLDEFDGMLKASQDALRNIMETYSGNVFFILTCNNINKVIDPLKNRCVVITFAYPKKEEIQVYLEMICEKEGMDYTDDGLKLLIEMNYPSIRNCVISLQDLFTQGLPVTKDTVKPVNEEFEVMWKYYKEKDWQKIKEFIMSSTADPRELNYFFWNKALNEVPTNNKLIQITCRNERDIAWGADAKVIFVTSLIEMVK